MPAGIKAARLVALMAAMACPGAGQDREANGAPGEEWKIPGNKADFHVFVLYGQSNMAGGIKEHQPGHLMPEDGVPVPHVLQVRSHARLFLEKGWFPAVHPLHVIPGRPNSFGLGLPFAKKYLEKHPGVTVGLLPCAYGGKRMDLLKEGSGLYETAIAKCRFALQRGTIKGVLWHQGESDAFDEERMNSYEGKLHQLVAAFRRDLEIPDLPFISGEITPKYPKDNPVQAANRTLPEKVRNTGWVSIEGLTFVDGEKQVHFDRESYIRLGHRYCEAYEKVVGGQEKEEEEEEEEEK